MDKDEIRSQVTGVILAGGRGKRYDGQDKGLIRYRGDTMMNRILSTLDQHLDKILINANRNHELYQQYGCEVISDLDKDFNGPLAGIYSSLLHIKTDYAFVVPCDMPELSAEVLRRMYFELQQNSATLSVARIENKMQPVVLLMKVNLRNRLQKFLETGERKAGLWVAEQKPVFVDFDEHAEWFVNVNTLDDMKKLVSQSQ